MELTQYPEDIDFKKYWLILKRNWLPAGCVSIVVFSLFVVFAAMQKPVYEAEGKLLFRKRDTTSTLLTDRTDQIGVLEALNSQNSPIDTEAEIVRSLPVIEKTIETLNLRKNGELVAASDVLKNLTVKGIKGTDVLLVTYKSRDPEEAAAIVNQVIKSYTENNVLTNRTEATAAREFISEQLPKTEAQLKQAEINLRNFREQNKVVSLKDEAQSAVTTMAELDNEIAKVRSEFEGTNAQVKSLQSKVGLSSDSARALNELSQSTAVQKAFEDLYQVESQLAAQRSRFADDAPVVANLLQRRANLKAILQERVSGVLGSQPAPQTNVQVGESEQKLIDDFVNAEVNRIKLFNQLNALLSFRNNYQQRANVLPRLEQRQQELERKVETAKVNYELFVRRLQEVQIAENQNLGNARLVAAATVPDKPTASKKKLILMGGAVVSSLIYVIAAFALDLRDPSIKTTKEVRDFFKYPWLGMIPLGKKKPNSLSRSEPDLLSCELPTRDNPYSPVSEAYRMLQSNLKFLKPDRTIRTITVTSSVSKEGKSTISANLAMTIAQIGKRVLLVDADLHHPAQHHIWQLTNDHGLSNVIVNQVSFEKVVKTVETNLDILPAGAVPPNPLALINSNRMADFIQDVAQKYDYVIFDTPPIIPVSDVLTLAKMTDGILVVVRPGVIDASTAATAKEFLTQSGQDVLGMVINGVTAMNEPDSYLNRVKTYHEDSNEIKTGFIPGWITKLVTK